jgi:hypothetical protein
MYLLRCESSIIYKNLKLLSGFLSYFVVCIQGFPNMKYFLTEKHELLLCLFINRLSDYCLKSLKCQDKKITSRFLEPGTCSRDSFGQKSRRYKKILSGWPDFGPVRVEFGLAPGWRQRCRNPPPYLSHYPRS